MKNAFVTGGSRGIGQSIVLRYIQEGWGVAFSYAKNKAGADETISMAQEINPQASIRAYQLDLREINTIEVVSEQIIDDFTNITTVVNNAATVKDSPAVLMSNEDWDEVITVNLTAPFILSRSFLFHFISNKNGHFIHISSLSADGSSGQINYAASKAGLHGLSRTLAKEYGKSGIRSNIITVGYVPTEMTENNLSSKLTKYWTEHCPARRVGTKDEVAAAVLFFSMDESSFTTGENLRISGGFTYAP